MDLVFIFSAVIIGRHTSSLSSNIQIYSEPQLLFIEILWIVFLRKYYGLSIRSYLHFGDNDRYTNAWFIYSLLSTVIDWLTIFYNE